MSINGISITGYRSFGSTVQRIGPFSKVNLIVGKNNSGKSNVLRAIYERGVQIHHRMTAGQAYAEFKGDDIHRGLQAEDIVLGLGAPADNEALTTWVNSLPNNYQMFPPRIIESNHVRHVTDLLWFEAPSEPHNRLPHSYFTDEAARDIIDSSSINGKYWATFANQHCNHGQMLANASCLNHIYQTMLRVSLQQVPQVAFVTAIRKVEAGGPSNPPPKNTFDGQGIINELDKLDRPPAHDEEGPKKFQKIIEFAQYVIGNSSIRLAIPHDRDTINVEIDGKRFPLESMGTGIHEVILLASVATVLENHVICMEEPEIHLHPILQRKLLAYLKDSTKNQYFITTHSGYMLDVPDISIFHACLNDGYTEVLTAASHSEKFEICHDLGCRASDIMQSNCVIWVEGPSDKMYLNHWISESTSKLVEGIHYSIMFYGGGLLNYVSASDPLIDEFISLRRINRNMVVVMDRDTNSKSAKLKDTKIRIKKEFNNERGSLGIGSRRTQLRQHSRKYTRVNSSQVRQVSTIKY